jgi:Amidase
VRTRGDVGAPLRLNAPVTPINHQSNEIRSSEMGSKIIYLDTTKLAELIRSNEVSVQIVQAHLAHISAVDSKINAIVSLAADALDDAKTPEAAMLRGNDLGPRHGVSFTVKDSIEAACVPTQRGSPRLAESTILHLASLLEGVRPVRNLHPDLSRPDRPAAGGSDRSVRL